MALDEKSPVCVPPAMLACSLDACFAAVLVRSGGDSDPLRIESYPLSEVAFEGNALSFVGEAGKLETVGVRK